MSANKRRDMDVTKLMMKDYKVELTNDDMKIIEVEFHGPNESLYRGGVWKVMVGFPDDYPYKPPSILFLNNIYHPNIAERSGSICLNVLAKDWSPTFDLFNVFEHFLPQLLLEPNPSDPINMEAAALMICNKPEYELKVKEHCQQHAKPKDESPPEGKSSDDEPSENDNDSSDEQVVGTSDPLHVHFSHLRLS